MTIDEIARKIVREFRPEKIILFGSHAWGVPTEDSDIDLFIIKDTNKSTREVARDIDGALWERTIPLDIIVYTPEKVAKWLKMGDFFISDIIHKGKILYERRN